MAHRIDPDLMDDLNDCAPSVMEGLIEQHKTVLAKRPSSSRTPPSLGVAPPLGVTSRGSPDDCQRSKKYSAVQKDRHLVVLVIVVE